jgi:hypothetical protein
MTNSTPVSARVGAPELGYVPDVVTCYFAGGGSPA